MRDVYEDMAVSEKLNENQENENAADAMGVDGKNKGLSDTVDYVWTREAAGAGSEVAGLWVHRQHSSRTQTLPPDSNLLILQILRSRF